MHIYIIDNGGATWGALARFARGTGYQTEAFADAQAFLAAATTTPSAAAYGCVLLPACEAPAVLAGLAGRVPVWPVVVLSGGAEVDAAITALGHAALHFLSQSYGDADLSAVLRDALAAADARLAEHRRLAQAAPIRLSQREREVLGALADGRQSKVIAWHLGVSVRTVDFHRSNILTKLGARNASQAVSIALDLKLLDTA